MPFNAKAMLRRRILLNMTQQDVAITAGLATTTISGLERELGPNQGGKTGIDVAMRIAEALQMDVMDLLIAPTGNKYQNALRFARAAHSAAGAPKAHDRSRTVMGEGYRRVLGDKIEVPEAPQEAEPILEPSPPMPVDDVPEYGWQKDTSTE